METLAEDGIKVELGDDQVFYKGRAASDNVSMLLDHEALAVENEFVLTANEITVGDKRGVVGSARCQETFAGCALAFMIRRGGNVDDQLGVTVDGLIVERSAWVPEVFANVYGELQAAPIEHLPAMTGREVALFVEHAVVGQVTLAVNADELAVMQHGRGVEEIALTVDETNHGDESLGGGQEAVEGAAVVGDEAGLEQQVLGRIARDRKLGEDDEMSLGGAGLLDSGEHAIDIAGEITDGRVDLSQRNAERTHGREYGTEETIKPNQSRSEKWPRYRVKAALCEVQWERLPGRTVPPGMLRP